MYSEMQTEENNCGSERKNQGKKRPTRKQERGGGTRDPLASTAANDNSFCQSNKARNGKQKKRRGGGKKRKGSRKSRGT